MDLTFVLIVTAILIILWLGWNARVSWQNFKFWRSKRRGAKGEDIAVNLLESLSQRSSSAFEFSKSQVAVYWPTQPLAPVMRISSLFNSWRRSSR